MDYSKIEFPCEAEYTKGEGIWSPCLVLGIFQEGSTVVQSRNLVMLWLIVNEEGEVSKIYKITDVRFSRYSK